MADMSFEEFEIDWRDYAERNPEQRLGQALSNYLYQVDSLLFWTLADTGFDPFFNDEGILDALAFLKEHWDD